jgi:hypothetical protein
MKREFTIGRKTVNGFIPATMKTFDSYRIACDYKDEFYGGPGYAVMSREVTEWAVEE